MPTFNTSYARQYAVVSKTDDQVILRVLDSTLYSTYWKEFISATATPETPTAAPMYLRLEQVPPNATLVDQYASYTPELPTVTIEVNGERVNVTARITANTPNTEVPGLFRIDYRINLSHDVSAPIWASYVSIQQRPILRKAAAGWVRDSYITRTLNRLVMEPQFMEALHAAGEPLYGFMEANQHPSVRAANLYQYGGVQAFGTGGAIGSRSNAIFISGKKLPQGSVVIYQRRMLQLREPVWPDPAGTSLHMDAETHERAEDTYAAGKVVRHGDSSYICIAEASPAIPMGDESHWVKGHLYKFNVLNGDGEFVLPKGRLPFGKGYIEHIWITVDDQGYSFWVDITGCTSLGNYRGYYDRRNFADYGPGDIVSYLAEDSIRLFKRKATDIQAPETLLYPPGHHLNPAWDEIYARFEGELSPLFSEYSVVPHTNSANAIVAKTWSVSEEVCEAYGNMMGIPPLIVKECGAKWSALLFALLSRTRNTYEGLRVCFRAVGLDVENLRLSEPSIAYYCMPGEDAEERVDDIYKQHENLRRLLANITTLAPEGEAVAKEGSLRYVTEKAVSEGAASANEIGVAIQQYSEAEGSWVTRYRFERIEPAECFNNRYYKGDLNVLARLAEDAVAELGDGHPWVKESAWAGRPSALVAECLAYEIPIYVYLRLKIWIYAEGNIEMQGFTYSGLFDGQCGGQKNAIELFPSKYFSHDTGGFVEVETGVYMKDGEDWVSIPPTRFNEKNNSKIYEFDQTMCPIRIMAADKSGLAFVRYWQSTHTFGLLGLPESTSSVNEVPFNPAHPGNFHNVTDPAVTDESGLILLNGHVGVTAVYRPKALYATASALRWMYVFEEGDACDLSKEMPFADMEAITATALRPYAGSLADMKAALDHLAAGPRPDAATIPFEWDGDEIVFKDAIPGPVYMIDGNGNALGAYVLVRGPYTLTAEDCAEYVAGNNMVAARMGFEYR